MSVKRLSKAQGVQALRELSGIIDIPHGTKLATIFITIDEREGPIITIAMDEPIMESEPIRPAIIERDECTDYAGL